jgi:anti-sigma regulatory factor (Ser/Thr protein kinase)
LSFDDLALGESAELDRRADLMEVSVSAGAAGPAVARRALRHWLAAHGSDQVLVDASLVVSELVTNSVRHAGLPKGARVRVSAALAAGVLRLEVQDGGTSGTVAPRAPSEDGGGGFGLNIIEAVALRWGVERHGATLLWAELRC